MPTFKLLKRTMILCQCPLKELSMRSQRESTWVVVRYIGCIRESEFKICTHLFMDEAFLTWDSQSSDLEEQWGET
jgi:hypothetical protein